SCGPTPASARRLFATSSSALRSEPTTKGARAAVSASPEEAVLLLHGAWMNRWVMSYLALALQREGFAVQTLSYRTMRGTLAEHLARVAGGVAALEAPRLHLVGHSLGGVIALRYLQRGADPRVRRAVLLGSPVAGCRAAADLAQSAGGELLLGPASRCGPSRWVFPSFPGSKSGASSGPSPSAWAAGVRGRPTRT